MPTPLGLTIARLEQLHASYRRRHSRQLYELGQVINTAMGSKPEDLEQLLKDAPAAPVGAITKRKWW